MSRSSAYPTQGPPHCLGDGVVMFTDDSGFHGFRGRRQRVYGGIEALCRYVARQHERGVHVPEHLDDGGIRVVIRRNVDGLQ